MNARGARLLALLLALGCATVVPKSRIEPHERAAVELRGETALALGPAGAGLEAAALDAQLLGNVTRELGQRRSLAPDRNRAGALLAVRLVSVALVAEPGELRALRITAASRVETGGEDPGKPRSGWHASDYESAARPEAEWSAEGGKRLGAEIATGLGHIADEVVAASLRPQQEGK